MSDPTDGPEGERLYLARIVLEVPFRVGPTKIGGSEVTADQHAAWNAASLAGVARDELHREAGELGCPCLGVESSVQAIDRIDQGVPVPTELPPREQG